ncbi:hypothetical protein ACY2DA_02105 [Staphylococcus simulans]
MKRFKIILGVLLSLAFIAACGTHEQDDKQTSKTTEHKPKQANSSSNQSSETKHHEKTTKISNESTDEQKKEPEIQTGPITEQELKYNVALMLLNPNFDQSYIAGQEVLSGQYSASFQGQIHHFKVNEVRLLQGQYEPNVIQAPEDMKFYTFDPQTGPFAVYVGVSHDKVVIWRSQAAYENYPELRAQGEIIEYRVSDLKKLNISRAQIQSVTNKIVLGHNERQQVQRLD